MKFIPLIFLFLIPLVTAQIITVGIEPAKVTVYGNQDITFKLFNDRGDTDAIYTFNWGDCREHIDFGDGCYDGSDILVPKGTDRTKNPVTVKVCFRPKKSVECRFYVEGRPVGYEKKGMVSIRPRIAVPVKLNKYEDVVKSPATSKSGEERHEKRESVFQRIKKIIKPPVERRETKPTTGTTTTTTTVGTVGKGEDRQEVTESGFPVPLLVVVLLVGSSIVLCIKKYLWW